MVLSFFPFIPMGEHHAWLVEEVLSVVDDGEVELTDAEAVEVIYM